MTPIDLTEMLRLKSGLRSSLFLIKMRKIKLKTLKIKYWTQLITKTRFRESGFYISI